MIISEILEHVSNRPQPKVELGPIDLSCSFLITDVSKPDMPIVYSSQSFHSLTGYFPDEIIGRNCRFLQAPNGIVQAGVPRICSDNSGIYRMKKDIESFKECQHIKINYLKNGQPFVNLVTIIPISLNNSGVVSHIVGFQVDLLKQSKSVLHQLPDGSYIVNFNGQILCDIPSSIIRRYEFIQSPYSFSIPYRHKLQDYNLLQGNNEYLLPEFGSNLTNYFLPAHTEDFDAFDYFDSISPFEMDRIIESIAPSSNTISSKNNFITLGSNQKSRTRSIINTDKKTYGIENSNVGEKTSISGIEDNDFIHQKYLNDNFPFVALGINLIKESLDFIHIISSRGLILFASPFFTKTYMGFESSDLVGKNISEISYSGDASGMLRELRMLNPGVKLHSFYPIKTKSNDSMCLNVIGHSYVMNNSKKTKCYILTGRPFFTSTLSHKYLAIGTIQNSPQIWAKISTDGLFLYATGDFPLMIAKNLYGKSILDFVNDDSKIEVLESLMKVRNGLDSTFEAKLRQDASTKIYIRMFPHDERSNQLYLFVHITLKIPSDSQKTLAAKVFPEKYLNSNVFKFNQKTSTNSIQFEINQLKAENRRLSEEIAKVRRLSMHVV